MKNIKIENCSQDINTVLDVRKHLDLFASGAPILGWDCDTGSYKQISKIGIHQIRVGNVEKHWVVIALESFT